MKSNSSLTSWHFSTYYILNKFEPNKRITYSIRTIKRITFCKNIYIKLCKLASDTITFLNLLLLPWKLLHQRQIYTFAYSISGSLYWSYSLHCCIIWTLLSRKYIHSPPKLQPSYQWKNIIVVWFMIDTRYPI